MRAHYKSVRELVRLARGPVSQRDFAARIGIEQPQLSRYESGAQYPSAKVIDQCLAVLGERTEQNSVLSAPALAERVRDELGGEHKVVVRALVQDLLDALGRRGPGRPSGGQAQQAPKKRRRG